jgi:tungstate transport system substrate-binding protein
LAVLAFVVSGCGNSQTQQTTVKPTDLPVSSVAPSDNSKKLILATTTSVADTGLMEYLKPEFEKDTGYKFDYVAQGSGQALKTAQNGDCDALLVHSPKDETDFVAKGFGVERIPILYNYFVIVGPKDDPAGLLKASSKLTAQDAFKMIAQNKSVFISRNDQSGTNKKELDIWSKSGVKTEGDWYVKSGVGMAQALTMASEKKAYTLSDKGTFLATKDKTDLQIVLGESEDLKNTYSVIAVNSKNNAKINVEGAQEFVKWITSEKTLNLIEGFKKNEYGESLFKNINQKGS